MSSLPNIPEEPLLLSQEDGFGYFPARPGERLKDSRYQIIGKLGWGQHSSTWLVADVKQSTGKRYHALKVLTANATQQNKDGRMCELQIMQTIAWLRQVTSRSVADSDDGISSDEEESGDDDDSEEYDLRQLPQLLDCFEVEGPHGSHLCIVTDIYSTNVANFRTAAPSKKLALHIVKIITGLILSPLAKLHIANIIHTHVTPDKVLFHQGISDDKLETHFKTASTHDNDLEINGVKYPIIRSHPIPTAFAWDDEAMVVKLYMVHLTSLGHGQVADNIDATRVRTPYPYRAPEVVLRAEFDGKVDIWAVGCMVFELLTGHPCFIPEAAPDWGIEEDYLAKVMQLTGEKFPEELLARSELRDEYFAEAGTLKRVDPLPPISIEEGLAEAKTLDSDGITQTASFIRACLHLDPDQRPAAGSLDLHDWLMGASLCADYREPAE